MKPTLLIVDDEPGIVETMKSYFSPQYDILTAYNGQEAVQKAENQPDLILLDINMPGMDGLTVCQTIRNHVTCPILFLTARVESADQIVGFQAGADDYIVKPFDLDELSARIAAHLRREQRRNSPSAVRFFGECAVDYSARTVTVRGEAVPLSRREFDILELLSLNAGQVFDRERIYETVWGIDGEGSSDTVMEHIRKIRAKLAALLWTGCNSVKSRYPLGGVSIGLDGEMTFLPSPSPEQLQLLTALDVISLLGWVLLPPAGLGLAGALFYRWKLKEPIALLLEGARRIQTHDLDFTIPAVSADELGQTCAAFEDMRLELLKTNRELWRQTEERKRLNAAFAHDLRNPITVLKGSVRLLRQDASDPQVLDRLERYTVRIEQYVEAMSSIQRLEQMPVRTAGVSWAVLRSELEETARLLAPGLEAEISAPDQGTVVIDHGIFLTAAENLIGNGARFGRRTLTISLTREGNLLSLSVADDGPGFPDQLLQSGPKPFGKLEENAEHFGMGLYTSGLLCRKHGGSLRLENRGGAAAVAVFQIFSQP